MRWPARSAPVEETIIPRVTLPPGCYGLDLPGGRRITAQPGANVEVSETAARAIRSSWYAHAGVMNPSRYTTGTKAGRWCRSCSPARLWNAWSTTCPRCGADTEPEEATS